ncbi:protein-associating with the carboxyl-terminal domain of ezrin [Ischnura elegans]|uniref:protein-associating with the carboxyl-terminal domain of ezrin n=1 Tax=Ischnura elegans TaxID=197161 RepID=UPI001ED875FB|nr:protein-associating with the carboxyl-terminal domain of ezrin [Ischnura elegans]
MGNEGSQPIGLEIEERAVEATDSWTLHYASINGSTPRLSVFVGQTQEGKVPSALELSAKNLMLYRHPSLVRYVSSWQRGDCWHLATEEIKPLAQVLSQLTPIQICLGLHSILKALTFLHDKAEVSHNNVCCASVYVTPDGTWKLCGFEHLCRFKDLTPAFLKRAQERRYERAITPEEDDTNGLKTLNGCLIEPWAIDTYAFGVLAEEVLRPGVGRALGTFTSHDLPVLAEFKELMKKQLQSSVPSSRPKLSSILEHPFFSHPLIRIHGFLVDLPLKTEAEKDEFFRNLPNQLLEFPEMLVAIQLGALLLSRMVLINSSAQKHLIPRILNPRPDGISKVLSVEEEEDLEGDNHGSPALFTLSTFREHLAPRLLQIFGVRDAQIRLILLTHFPGYCKVFSEESLRTVVLPELLVGIKDTNDTLVSTTLHCLAELVPLLGAATVIGGKRGKLFTDGRPKERSISSSQSSRNVLRTPSSVLAKTVAARETLSGIYRVAPALAELPERPSPDGGEEGVKVDMEKDDVVEDVVVDWSDWDAPEEDLDSPNAAEDPPSQADEVAFSEVVQSTAVVVSSSNSTESNTSSKDSHARKDRSKSVCSEEEDFFKDMEPVISKTQILRIEARDSSQSSLKSSNAITSLSFNSAMDTGEGSGWGEDLEWGDEELEIE